MVLQLISTSETFQKVIEELLKNLNKFPIMSLLSSVYNLDIDGLSAMDFNVVLNYIELGGVILGLKYGYEMIRKIMVQRAMKRWEDTEKNKVILHTVPRVRTLPSPSPYSLKLETFFRMAGIKYEIDNIDTWFGPKGKFPWISLNGSHYSDSQLIIDMLKKKFDISFNGSYSDEELATATAVRVMLEEHFSFGAIALWRFGFGLEHLDKVFNYSPSIMMNLKYVYSRYIKTLTWYQGIGRNSEDEILELMIKDMQAVSDVLGDKKFLLGNEVCEDDCAVFGIMAQVMWGLIGSPYESLLNDRFPNIKNYCLRMKENFYPDWNELIQN